MIHRREQVEVRGGTADREGGGRGDRGEEGVLPQKTLITLDRARRLVQSNLVVLEVDVWDLIKLIAGFVDWEISPVAVTDATLGAAGRGGDTSMGAVALGDDIETGAAPARFPTPYRTARAMVEPPEMPRADGEAGATEALAGAPLNPAPAHFCRRSPSESKKSASKWDLAYRKQRLRRRCERESLVLVDDTRDCATNSSVDRYPN